MADEDVTIRPMRPADVEAARRILEQWNMAPRTDVERSERRGIEVANSFVAERSGRVVGLAGFLPLDEATAETASLAVDPLLRGTGIGYRLQLARLEEIARRGFRRVLTETDRPEVVEWYVSKFGYRQVGTRPKYHDFSLAGVDEWAVLELDVDEWVRRRREDQVRA